MLSLIYLILVQQSIYSMFCRRFIFYLTKMCDMKKLLLLLFSVLIVSSALMAQRTINGTVVDDAGSPLIGASVVVKENPKVGTITDLDGKFRLKADANAKILIVSFIGFSPMEVELGSSNDVIITLKTGIQLEDVVINSFVPNRNSRNVTYSNQTVKSEDLLTQPLKNALEALRGKAAGVNITQASGSVGASNRIVLRGEGSLTGNNNALIVVDGIPIDNASTGGGAMSAQDGYSDYGNRFNDLNPDDIESVTILKGPSATALYGSRGASGVLVVTTKKGKTGSMEIVLNSSYSREKAYVLLQRQDQFGQGYDNAHFDSGENWSWGPAFDGVERPWTTPVDVDGDGALECLKRPFSAVPDQIENFFNIGQTFGNSLSLSGAKNDFSYYASYSNIDQTGILENTKYKRNTLNFKASAKLSPKLTSDFGINYSMINTNTAQEGYRPFEGQNSYANVIQTPVNIPFNELRDYKNPFHDLNGYYGSYSTNPYFILNEYINEGKFNNLIGNISLNYELLKNLNIKATAGLNNVVRSVETGVPIYSSPEQLVWTDNLELTTRNTRNKSVGEYSRLNGSNTNLNFNIISTYKTSLTKSIGLQVSGGYELFDRRTNSVSGRTIGGLVVPGWFNFDNSVQTPKTSEYNSKYRIMGLLGNASLDYKNFLFLEYSGRNDWSSTLPQDKNSFFYQGFGVSAVLSDIFGLKDNDYLNFLKIRGGIGTTGKDADLYLLESYFVGNPVIQSLNQHDITTPLNGQPGFTVGNYIGNPDLKPELTTLYELGADIALLKDRINLTYTYYTSLHSNQIIRVGLPSSSGYTETASNVGKMTNKGHELGITLKPIHGLVNGLDWDINFIFSKNDNKVNKISDDSDELVIGGPYTNGSISIVAKEDLPFGTFKSTVWEQNSDGKFLVDQTGLPVLTAEEEYLGSFQPKYKYSLGSSIGFKGLTLNVLIDAKVGGKFLSITKNQAEFNGTSLTSLIGARDSFILENTVVKLEDGTYSQNNNKVTAQQLYAVSDVLFGGSSLLIDASFVKLRELGLSYTLPKSLLKKFNIKNATIGVYGNNLKFWLPEENTYADPEINGPGLSGNTTGIETTQTPPSHSYGVKLNLIF
jgi:TonB-linked SusC/RagA family outer membrane protein